MKYPYQTILISLYPLTYQRKFSTSMSTSFSLLNTQNGCYNQPPPRKCFVLKFLFLNLPFLPRHFTILFGVSCTCRINILDSFCAFNKEPTFLFLRTNFSF